MEVKKSKRKTTGCQTTTTTGRIGDAECEFTNLKQKLIQKEQQTSQVNKYKYKSKLACWITAYWFKCCNLATFGRYFASFRLHLLLLSVVAFFLQFCCQVEDGSEDKDKDDEDEDEDEPKQTWNF